MIHKIMINRLKTKRPKNEKTTSKKRIMYFKLFGKGLNGFY
jgi:hypothetical protein